MKVLGLNAFHGDASAAVLVNGELAAALEEERLNRIKHWAGFPGPRGARMSRRDGSGARAAHCHLARPARAFLDEGRTAGDAAWRLEAFGVARQEHG